MNTVRNILIVFVICIFFSSPAYADNHYDYTTVYNAQVALNNMGYQCGTPDGDIGTDTRSAIVSFRQDHHLGDSTEIDDVLLYALGTSDAPVWFPFFNNDDKYLVEDDYLFNDACSKTIIDGLNSIGANLGAYLGLGNYIQIDDDTYSFAFMCNADENEEILTTVRVSGDKYEIESIQSYLTGDYFYRISGDTVPYSKTGYSHAALEIRSLPEVSENTPTPTQAQTGTDYVLNKNTHKFHHTWCSSADDIKTKNRWDYNGTREEIIGMGYEPCKRCNP